GIARDVLGDGSVEAVGDLEEQGLASLVVAKVAFATSVAAGSGPSRAWPVSSRSQNPVGT
ncbi:hypothetical protein, partial [Amycolatopsis japonica]